MPSTPWDQVSVVTSGLSASVTVVGDAYPSSRAKVSTAATGLENVAPLTPWPRPPSMGMLVSAVPWMASTDTGWLGLQSPISIVPA